MPEHVLAPIDRKLPARAALGTILGAAAALVFSLGLMTGRWITVAEPGPAQRCALPAGIALDSLGAPQRERVVDRVMLCVDHERGALSGAEYRAAAAALAASPAEIPTITETAAPAAPAAPVWASSLRSVSSQYGEDDWSARQVLGPPDVQPTGQDSVKSWASLEADAAVETIELGFGAGHRMSAVEVFESLAPGAISRIELVFEGGRTALVEQRAAAATDATSAVHRVSFACTDEPVVGVRVTLDSAAVPGWNEIDAIGARPCGE
jgi:hypothetical protein